MRIKMLRSATHVGAQWLGLIWVLCAGGAMASEDFENHLSAAMAGEHRGEANRARDRYRHPQQTLAFLEVRPDMTVVEISPGGGWYTEILAPYLREQGQYYAAHFPVETSVTFYKNSRRQFQDKLAANPDVYDRVVLTEFYPPSGVSAGPEGAADRVLTFRNVHNWMKAGYAEEAFKTFAGLLKPGGVLGVVEHRAQPGTPLETMIKSGYVTEAHVIALAKAAGLELEARSEINANGADTADHPAGVWTLPPTLRLKDQEREKYLAIGESDRMTLRFRKPTQ